MKLLPESLRFDWSLQQDELPADAMNRASHARFLTSLLLSKSETGCYVLNLNASWGAGKSWFLRRWQAEISSVYPTVYVDAWKNDHLQDPLLNVVAEIRRSLIARTDKAALDSRLLKGTWRLFKAVAPEVTKALLKSRLGIDSDALAKILSDDSSADVGAKLVEAALQAHDEAGNSVEEFREGIAGWLRAVINTASPPLSYPLFVFIDELDRCRPTYAVEMLETIKHIFSIEHVVFVIATDKAQLQHSIRAIYGSGFDSRLYLDRFFNRSVTLNEVSRKSFILERYRQLTPLRHYCASEPGAILLEDSPEREGAVIEILTGIADGFSMQLRTVDLWLDRLAAAVVATVKKPDVPFMAFLMAIETHAPEKLEEVARGRPVFTTQGVTPHDALSFKAFTLKLRWNYQLCQEHIAGDHERFAGRLQQMFGSKIGMVHYFQALMAGLIDSDRGQNDSVAFLRSSFREYLSNQHPRASVYQGDNAANAYHQEVTHILRLRHAKNTLTLGDCYALCRLATHLE